MLETSADDKTTQDEVEVQTAELTPLSDSADNDQESATKAAIESQPLELKAVLGGATLTLAELYALKKDSVLKLDSEINRPVDLVLDDRIVARGELVVVEDHFGIQVTELFEKGV